MHSTINKKFVNAGYIVVHYNNTKGRNDSDLLCYYDLTEIKTQLNIIVTIIKRQHFLLV